MAEPLAPSAAKVQPSSKRPLGFLDLDRDIRFQVYDILEDRPKNDLRKRSYQDYGSYSDPEGYYSTWMWVSYDFDKFEITRKSLRLTCWTIAEEWTPAFFRSTTICMNGQRTPPMFIDFFLEYAKDGAARPSDHEVEPSDSAVNRNAFVDKPIEWRQSAVKNIRRIEFAWSRDDNFIFFSPWEVNRCRNKYRSDAKRLQEFGAILRHHKPKLRLETVHVAYWPGESRYMLSHFSLFDRVRLADISVRLYMRTSRSKWLPPCKCGNQTRSSFCTKVMQSDCLFAAQSRL